MVLNNTLQYFEQRIQSVEQRLAERDSNFKSLLNANQQSSPQRNRTTYQAAEEEMLRNINDYQKQISANESKYRQL
jgi:hypothetical protein